jgi:Putative DnaT-like ssDNA binding protein
MALVATVGGASSNSYVTLAEANAYFTDRIDSTTNGDWTNDDAGVARTDAAKSAALVTATRRIDEESFLGVKVSTTQALKWPRVSVYDEDGFPFATDSIPERVKQATYMVALELLRTDFIKENYLNNFSFLATGSIQMKQFTQQSAGRLPSEATRLLRMVLSSGSGGGRLVRA